MMVLRTVTFRGLCDNVNLISTETFWQSSEMLMWRLVGILKWTADWLSFYWNIKTALNGTTQRGMSSAYLLNFYQLLSPFKKILCHNWLTWQGHMNITEIPNWSLSLSIFFFKKRETETSELHHWFLNSRRFPSVIYCFSPNILRRVIDLTPYPGFCFVWTRQSRKTSNKTIHFASKASAKTLVSKAHWWFVFISQNLLQLYYSPFICTTAIA